MTDWEDRGCPSVSDFNRLHHAHQAACGTIDNLREQLDTARAALAAAEAREAALRPVVDAAVRWIGLRERYRQTTICSHPNPVVVACEAFEQAVADYCAALAATKLEGASNETT